MHQYHWPCRIVAPQHPFHWSGQAKTVLPTKLTCHEHATHDSPSQTYAQNVLLGALRLGRYHNFSERIVEGYFSYGLDGSLVRILFKEYNQDSQPPRYVFYKAAHVLRYGKPVYAFLILFSFHVLILTD